MAVDFRYRVFVTEARPGQEALRSALEAERCGVAFGRPFEDPAGPYSDDELRALVADADAILMMGSRDRITRRVMEAATKLRTIAKTGIGVEPIDVQAATELGILVSHTPIPENYLSVAEGTVARILALAKNLKLADRNARLGRWRSVTNTFLQGKTVGIVGLGRIGSRVAELLRPFQVRLVAYSPSVSPERGRRFGVELVDLPTLLREADFVTLHAVVTAKTRGMIGEPQLRLMKPTAYLVNTARGVLVDEEVLARALGEGWIAGAALDVFDPEPLRPESPLLAEDLFDRTVFSPHSAAATPELRAKMPLVQLENCLRALRGETPEYVVNPEVLSRWRARWLGSSKPAGSKPAGSERGTAAAAATASADRMP
jgi:phosphoglycerate dehydrogenase-like enzyme